MTLRGRIGGFLSRLGASLVGPGLPSARADEDAGWNLVGGGDGPADRTWSELREDLTDSLEAWRKNAWVRQVVRLVSAYVVGDGIRVSASHPWAAGFVEGFWQHPQNRMAARLTAWCDELTRSGELFVALFSNVIDGMQYVRAVPASQIQRVETDSEDYEREVAYWEVVPGRVELRRWPSPFNASPAEPCMLHFAVNKPVGATRGESDLVPLLPWAARYTDWLKDRCRFNKLRSELAVAEVIVDDDTQVEAKRRQYLASPPSAGSLFIHGRGEELRFPSAEIAGYEAEADGKAIRLAMATAGDVPLHFFSEGDSATRATAVEMGDPTHRFYRQRQGDFCGFLVDLVSVAFQRRSALLGFERAPEELGIVAEAPDISRSDNEALAQAAATLVSALAEMRDRGWVSDERAIRLAFKFAGEVLSDKEIQEVLQDGGVNGSASGRVSEPGVRTDSLVQWNGRGPQGRGLAGA